MTRGRRLSAVLVGAVVALLLGRTAAVVYANGAWYDALGASAVWRERLRDVVALYGGAFAIGAAVAASSFWAVSGSVSTLIVQRKVGEVEFAEEISSGRISLFIALLAFSVSALSLAMLPSWTDLAIWRAGVSFGEMDPYFQLDLSFYVTWFPLELAAYIWSFTLLALTSVATVALYALTPSLRWNPRGIRVTAYARRHLTLLAVLLILFTAWGYRLDAYQALFTGSGPDGGFTRLDHEWRVPLEIGLSIVTVGAALVLLAAGWMGQTRTVLATVSLLLIAALVVKLVLPWGARAVGYGVGVSGEDAPYGATTALFTQRAFALDSDRKVRDSAAATPARDSASAEAMDARDARSMLVYPGAHGFALLNDSIGRIPAPHLGTGPARLMTAWALQNPHLLDNDIPPTAAVITTRDVRERVAAIAPVFSQGESLRGGAGPNSSWVVELFSTSRYYPLSTPRLVGGGVVTYARHAATAYVQAATGRVTIVPHVNPDPIAAAWFRAFPGSYLSPSAPSAPAPVPQRPRAVTGASGPADSAYHNAVARVYRRMRAALAAGNLEAFGAAFDSLGVVVGP